MQENYIFDDFEYCSRRNIEISIIPLIGTERYEDKGRMETKVLTQVPNWDAVKSLEITVKEITETTASAAIHPRHDTICIDDWVVEVCNVKQLDKTEVSDIYRR